jgi:4-hydroxy-2-oxoglutarate aldolase
MIYNFPNITAGLDVNSDMIDILGGHPNIVGIKFTCGSIAKVARAAATFPPEQFSAFAGQGDWLIPSMSVGGKGCITGLANLYPRVSGSGNPSLVLLVEPTPSFLTLSICLDF